MVLRAARLELFSTFSDQGARADGTRFRSTARLQRPARQSNRR